MNWFLVVRFRYMGRVFSDRHHFHGTFGEVQSFILEYLAHDVLSVTVTRVF